MSNLLFGLKFSAKISTSIFGGFAAYCTFIEQPARLRGTTREAIANFKSNFKQIATVQSVINVAATGTLYSLYYLEGERHWLVTASLMTAVLPYTVAFIMPVFKQLLDDNLDKDADKSRKLLVKWGNLHSLRTVAGLVTMGIVLWYA